MREKEKKTQRETPENTLNVRRGKAELEQNEIQKTD